MSFSRGWAQLSLCFADWHPSLLREAIMVFVSSLRTILIASTLYRLWYLNGESQRCEIAKQQQASAAIIFWRKEEENSLLLRLFLLLQTQGQREPSLTITIRYLPGHMGAMNEWIKADDDIPPKIDLKIHSKAAVINGYCPRRIKYINRQAFGNIRVIHLFV